MDSEARAAAIGLVSLLLGLCIGVIAGYELGSFICRKVSVEGGFTKFMAYSLPMLVCTLILMPLLRAAITAIANIFGQGN